MISKTIRIGLAGVPIILAASVLTGYAITARQEGMVSASVVSFTEQVETHPESLHEQVTATYNFLPRDLGKAELERKSKELDSFWDGVKAHGAAGLDDLRKELARNDLPSFFNYDGAKLLLTLSEAREDRALALTAISRADLRDIQWDDYFLTVHSLAVDGLDTSDAAFKILAEEKFKVLIPQHALTLDQAMCLLYLLIPTSESFYLDKAERRLFEERNVTSQKSLLTLLGYTVTRQGDAAISRFAADPKQSEDARAYARKIIEATKSMESAAVLGFSFGSYKSLKEEQRKLFARVSDEALSEWERLQVKIRRKGPE